MLDYSDLMTVIIPELAPCIGCEQHNIHHCYDVYEHICRSVEYIEPDEDMRLTMLFHDIGKPRKKTTDENGIDHGGCINVLTAVKPTPLSKGNPQHTNRVEIRKAFSVV